MKTLSETESQWQKVVLAYAKLQGWHTAHFRAAMMRSGKWATPVQGDGTGFPDLVLVRGCRLIFAELKSAKGKVAPAQTEWLTRLMGAGAECFIWRPKDWDQVKQVLAG